MPFGMVKQNRTKTERGRVAVERQVATGQTDVFIFEVLTKFCVASFTLLQSQHQSYLSWFPETIISN